MSSESSSSCRVPATAREVLAVNLIRLRAQRQWSQEALAFEAGLHRTFVAHVERRVRNISLDNVERLALAFGVETFELLTPMCGVPGRVA
jgi:transcriptional regulator with XRE-family HTH domain